MLGNHLEEIIGEKKSTLDLHCHLFYFSEEWGSEEFKPFKIIVEGLKHKSSQVGGQIS